METSSFICLHPAGNARELFLANGMVVWFDFCYEARNVNRTIGKNPLQAVLCKTETVVLYNK